jgi:hypothetical protein
VARRAEEESHLWIWLEEFAETVGERPDIAKSAKAEGSILWRQLTRRR